MIQVKLIRTYTELRELEGDWDWLLDQFEGANVFLTWDWISTWIEAYSKENQLFCLAAFKNEKLVGLAPLWLDRQTTAGVFPWRILKFIGSIEVCPDHLDFIIRRKNSSMIAEAMWNALFGEHRKLWDKLEYHSVSIDSKTANTFHNLADSDHRCLKVEIEGYRICPYLSLPNSWAAFVESMDARNRRNVRRSEKVLLEAGDIEFKCVDNRDDLPVAMQGMMDIHNDIWYSDKKKTGFRRARFREFHLRIAERLFEKGMLSACTLKHDGEHVGSTYSFVFRGKVYGYIIAVRRSDIKGASIGRALIYRYIRRLIEDGVTELDFLRGDEEYKFYWTDTDRRNLNSTFHNRRFASFVALAIKFSKFFFKEFIRSVLGRMSGTIKEAIGG